MTKLIEDLLALQKLLALDEATTLEQKAQIEELRGRIPEPILAHFLRQLAAGRRGVAFVRHAVCGECHIRISQAMVHMLGHTNDLLVCESCGAFIALAPEETVAVVTPMAVPKVRRVRKPRVVAA